MSSMESGRDVRFATHWAIASALAATLAGPWSHAQANGTFPARSKPVQATATAFSERSATASVKAAVAVPPAPRRHANGEHPGQIQWRMWQANSVPLDANHFIVQPPATTRWQAASGD